MPQNIDNNNDNYINGGSNNMWYSFDYSYVHFLMIDTETDYFGAPCDPNRHRQVVEPEAGGFGDQKKFYSTRFTTSASKF